MDWLKKLEAGLILTMTLLALASSFTAYLVVTHQSCSPTSSQTPSSTATSNAGLGRAAPHAPAPLGGSDLVLAPLANLSLSPGSSAPPDMTEPGFWSQVGASEIRTYEEILPQTVVGFFNSSEEWRAWALQNVPDPPGWLTTGFVDEAQSQVAPLDPVNGYNESAAAVRQGIDNFAASAAGVSLASLDFVSFNGLTALRTLFATNNPLLAACQTLPGQLAQLYTSSFDPGVPQSERADYLGRALAITSVVLLVGGKDGLADHFQTALARVDLADAWPAVKPYLGDVASKVSASAASAMLGILQTLAGRFPQDSVWATGLTADQVDAMVDVLHDKGVPNDIIQGDIQNVAQAAGSSPAEDGAAEVADGIEYQQDGGWLRMVVNGQNTLTVYTDATGRTQCITVTWLKTNVPGFDPTQAQFIQISYIDQDVAVYNYYSGPKAGSDIVDGGRQWKITAPADVAQPGTMVKVRLQILTPAVFMERMPLLEFNAFGLKAPWMAQASRFNGYTISETELKISVSQSVVGGLPIDSFEIEGKQAALNWNGKIVALGFHVVDAFGQPTDLRLVYDGYSDPQLRIRTGQTDFARVQLVSSDSVKLKFLYDTGPSSSSVTTVYVKTPSILWSLSDKVPGDPQYLTSGGTDVYQIDSVTPTRSIEAAMRDYGTTYDKGVLGAEIAYTVGTDKLGLQNLILREPSEGGVDLYTVDRTTFIQARLLDLSKTSATDIPTAIQNQLPEMLYSLHKDFANNKTATMGYVIISYIDNQHSIKTIIVQVPNQ